MQQYQTVYINFTGGIVSPGHFRNILQIAREHRVQQVRFGLRQQLIIDLPTRKLNLFSDACALAGIAVDEKKSASPNIVSSYPAAALFTGDTWLSEGVYKDVFSLFDYAPKLKINICDSTQSLVPFFTGHINWISSSSVHFWQLYVRLPQSGSIYRCPELVYTNDLAMVSHKIELLLHNLPGITGGEALFQELKTTVSFISKPAPGETPLPIFSLPYYEGFNSYNNQYWLGIYRRDECYSVEFLLDVCSRCIDSKIGQLYTTPWKSIIVKGINVSARNQWELVLGRYRINVRHAANELNWQVEDNSDEGLQIKRHIIRYFDKEDVRTFGLSFAVQTMPHSMMFGSVVIRKHEIKNPGRLKSIERFEILHTRDFKPNSGDLQSFRSQVEKEHLGPYLVSLCKMYYEQQQALQVSTKAIENEPKVIAATDSLNLYQCADCLTIFDSKEGDPDNGIKAGTKFQDLPESYECPLCSNPKAAFSEVSGPLSQVIS